MAPKPRKSYSLNSFKGGYIGDYMGVLEALLTGIPGVETMAHKAPSCMLHVEASTSAKDLSLNPIQAGQ